VALILSAGWSEGNSLEQHHHQEAAELEHTSQRADLGGRQLGPSASNQAAAQPLRLRAKQVVKALDGRGDLIQRRVPQLRMKSSGKARSHTPAPRGQAQRKLLTGRS
jgi:hypothetical protein